MKIMNQPVYNKNQVFPVRQTSSCPDLFSDASTQSDVEKLKNELTQKYQNIDFDFLSFDNTGQIKNYAATQSGMNNVAISPELLEKMTKDDALRMKVEHTLNSLYSYKLSAKYQSHLLDRKLLSTGIILDENGDVTQWTITEQQKKESDLMSSRKSSSSQNPFQNSKAKKNPYSTPYKYSQSSNMMYLASAKSVSAVRGLIARNNSEIAKVKISVTDPAEAAAIIRKIKNVIRSGNIKISRLHKENRIYQLTKMAEKRQKIKLERLLSEELRKKRTARKAQEHCQTACMEDIFVKPSVNDYKFKQIAERYSDTMNAGSSSPAAAPAAPMIDVAPAQAPAAMAVTIDCSA